MYFLKRKVFLYVFFSIFLIESFLLVCFLKTDFYNYFLASINPDSLLVLANKDRESMGIETLESNFILTQAASMKANHMVENGYFAHNSPDGINPWYWFEKAGYDFYYAGENLAVNFSDSARLHQAWIDSPSHRANIINGNFTQIGIASAQGIYKGREATFVVQLFGRPKEAKLILAEEKEQPEAIATTEISLAEPKAEVLSQETIEELSIENQGNYESFVAVAKDENNEISPIIANISTERKELKYIPLIGRFNSLFSGTTRYLLVLAFILITSLILRKFIKNLRLYEAFANGALILLTVFCALYLNNLLIMAINTKMQLL